MSWFLIIAAAIGGNPTPPPDVKDLEEQARRDCPNNLEPDPRIIDGLLAIEREEGVPPAGEGLLVAAACAESGIRPKPRAGDSGRSVGMFQFQWWARKAIAALRKEGSRGDPRLDWRASARFWIRHVLAQLPRVEKHCRGKRGFESRALMLVASANLTAVRAPKCVKRSKSGACIVKRPRCARRGTRGETQHVRLLRRWRAALPDEAAGQ